MTAGRKLEMSGGIANIGTILNWASYRLEAKH